MGLSLSVESFCVYCTPVCLCVHLHGDVCAFVCGCIYEHVGWRLMLYVFFDCSHPLHDAFWHRSEVQKWRKDVQVVEASVESILLLFIVWAKHRAQDCRNCKEEVQIIISSVRASEPINVQCIARPLEGVCFLGFFCLHSILGVAQMPSS